MTCIVDDQVGIGCMCIAVTVTCVVTMTGCSCCMRCGRIGTMTRNGCSMRCVGFSSGVLRIGNCSHFHDAAIGGVLVVVVGWQGKDTDDG